MTELSSNQQEPILMMADNVRNSVYAESKVWQGLKLEQQGYLEKAISCYRQAVRLYPESSEARDILALALRKQAQIQNIERETKKLSNPTNNYSNHFNSQLSKINQEGRIVLRNGIEKIENESIEESAIILPSVNSTSSMVNLRKSQPRIAQIYVEQAYAHMEKQQFESAIIACANAIDIEPQMAEAYKVWGNALYALGRSEEAMGYYAKALEIQPDIAEVYANLGTLFAKQKKWQQAIEYLEISLVYNPEFAGSYRNLAKIWEELGETDKAWSCMEKALDLEPELITPQKYVQFANELLQEKEWGKAIAFYNYALRLDTNFQEARIKLVQVLQKLGKQKEARLHYKKLLEIQTQSSNPVKQLPQKKLIKKFLGTSSKKLSSSKESFTQSKQKALPISPKENLSSSGEHLLPQSQSFQGGARVNKSFKSPQLLPNNSSNFYQEAKKQETIIDAEVKHNLSQAKEQPSSATIELNLGNSCLKKEQWNQAIAHYQKAIQLNPKMSAAYQNIAQVYRKIGKDEEALDFYYRFCNLEPDMVSAEKYLNLGGVLLKRQQLKRAKSCFKKALQKQPNYAEAYHCLGDVFVQEKKWKEAIAAYAKAIEINPQFSWSYQKLGDVWLKLENWAKAVESFQRAIALKDDFIWSHHNLGDAYSRLFQWDRAIAAYSKAIELKPDFAEAYAHLGDALIRQEKWDEGIKHYEKAIEINPGIDVSVYRNLKEALDRKKHLGVELGTNPALNNQEWPYEPDQIYQPPQTLPDGSPFPKISLVTPSYNQGEFIEETILSVIHQNYPNLEYILIDGGSSDNTMEVVNKYREHFAYVVSEPDRGQSNAINKGFAQATGEIFAWLNSDDKLAPSALYTMALAFYTSKADVVAGVCQIFKDGIEIEKHLTSCPNGKIPLDDLLDLENCWLQGKFFYQPEVMFTRAIWEKAGGKVNESLYYSMDYEMWVRFALKGAKLQVIGHPIAQYRLHDQQKTSTIEKYQPELLNVRDTLREQVDNSLSNQKTSLIRKRRSLKIVVLNDTGSLGGAGIAHQRIAQALALAGHQVVAVAGTLDWSFTPVNCTPEEVQNTIDNLNPDLLIIGNIHNFQYPVEILEKLTSLYPTVFVMHDQWLFTGRCGYTGDCENYTTLCDGECPSWEQYPRLAPQKIANAFARKQALLQNREELLILGDSEWLTNWSRYAYLNHVSRENYIDLDRKFQSIYYGLDVTIFRPQDQITSRRQLGLPEDKFIILTGSQSLEDERKGFKYLLKALEIMNLPNVLVLCFGHDFKLQTKLAIESVGYINNPNLLAAYYSAVDLFVSPALEEAFGQTFIEAAACGTPAVGFAVGGVKEAIKNKVSGRLVKQKTPEALAKTIVELYRDRDQLELLSKLAPLYVASNFAFTSSYHSIINALETSGWLSNLGMSAVSKFAPKDVPTIEYVTIKGNPTQPKSNTVHDDLTAFGSRTILMNHSLQGSGWFPAETVNGYLCRWMGKLGTIIIDPINSLEPLKIQLSVITAVDPRLLYSMIIKINGYSLKVIVNQCDDNSWICEAEISPELLTPKVPFLVSIEVPEVKHLAPNDPRKGSLLVRSLIIKCQQNDF